jgi:hypothetical protein
VAANSAYSGSVLSSSVWVPTARTRPASMTTTRWDSEAEAAVGLGQLGAVAEAHLLEGDRGGRAAGPGRLGGGAGGFDRELFGLADAGDRGRADLVLAGRPDQPLHRREQVVQVQQEGDEGAHVDRARGDPGAPPGRARR